MISLSMLYLYLHDLSPVKCSISKDGPSVDSYTF